MSVTYGPACVILHLPTDPNASDADIDRAIELVPSLRPGLRLHGHDPRTGQWPIVGTITRNSLSVVFRSNPLCPAGRI